MALFKSERLSTELSRHWAGFQWSSAYATLPASLYRFTDPTPVAAPGALLVNERYAGELGLDPGALRSPEGTAFLAGNRSIEGVRPLAQAYAGHQFGHFTILGDGRALLAGEHVTPDGRVVDVQWKGSGRTPFSRNGDGRLALGPALREFLVSEAMAGLGIPTTRSLAVVATGETVRRESFLPGAVLLRVAHSHLRVGTFEGARVSIDPTALPALLDFAVHRHAPEIATRFPGDAPEPRAKRARAFFETVIDRQARLVAEWMAVGFVHGVMNTDNTTVSGETIDFGPCAFVDDYAAGTVFSSIDHDGRYAFGNQPGILGWNLARLGDALLPVLGAREEEALESANAAMGTFVERFAVHFTARFGAKLGLEHPTREDMALLPPFLEILEKEHLDYTTTWRELADQAAMTPSGEWPQVAPALAEWSRGWWSRLAGEAPARIGERMRRANPVLIPRNHQVEAALASAHEGDLAPFRVLLRAVQNPYADTAENRALGAPPKCKATNYRTFCGT